MTKCWTIRNNKYSLNSFHASGPFLIKEKSVKREQYKKKTVAQNELKRYCKEFYNAMTKFKQYEDYSDLKTHFLYSSGVSTNTVTKFSFSLTF